MYVVEILEADEGLSGYSKVNFGILFSAALYLNEYLHLSKK